MSITIPNVFEIPALSADSAVPVSTPPGSQVHTYGFPYQGGKSTFAFYGNFTNVTSIKIQAAFDGGSVNNGNNTPDANPDLNFIDLTNSDGNAELITASNRLVTVDIGKCMLRFRVDVSGTMAGTINVAVSS